MIWWCCLITRVIRGVLCYHTGDTVVLYYHTGETVVLYYHTGDTVVSCYHTDDMVVLYYHTCDTYGSIAVYSGDTLLFKKKIPHHLMLRHLDTGHRTCHEVSYKIARSAALLYLCSWLHPPLGSAQSMMTYLCPNMLVCLRRDTPEQQRCSLSRKCVEKKSDLSRRNPPEKVFPFPPKYVQKVLYCMCILRIRHSYYCFDSLQSWGGALPAQNENHATCRCFSFPNMMPVPESPPPPPPQPTGLPLIILTIFVRVPPPPLPHQSARHPLSPSPDTGNLHPVGRVVWVQRLQVRQQQKKL